MKTKDKLRWYWFIDPEGRVIRRVHLEIRLRHVFLSKFPEGHKLVRHLKKP